MAYLRNSVPGLPTDLFDHPQRPVREVLSHAHRQAVNAAVRAAVPSVTRAALISESARVVDILYWLERASGAPEEPDHGPIARGVYRSASVRLRPVLPSDLDGLYATAMCPEFAHRWRFRGRTLSPEDFRQQVFRESVLAQFIAEGVDGAGPIALVAAHDPNLAVGYCYLSVQRLLEAAEDPARKGLSFEALFLLIQFVFDHFDLHKVYFEIPGFNLSLIEGGTTQLIVEEGRLGGHYFFGDRRWDLHIYALYRTRWNEFIEPFRAAWPEAHGVETTPGPRG